MQARVQTRGTHNYLVSWGVAHEMLVGVTVPISRLVFFSFVIVFFAYYLGSHSQTADRPLPDASRCYHRGISI